MLAAECDAGRLQRLLQAANMFSLFERATQDGKPAWRHSRFSAALCSAHPNNMTPLVSPYAQQSLKGA